MGIDTNELVNAMTSIGSSWATLFYTWKRGVVNEAKETFFSVNEYRFKRINIQDAENIKRNAPTHGCHRMGRKFPN